MVFGSEVHSFPFEGVISDCAVVYNYVFNENKKSNWQNKLYKYYNNYMNQEPGKRLDCLEVDCDLRNCVNRMHDYYGVPKVFLKKYDYNEEWRQKTLMHKLKKPIETMEPVNAEVATAIADKII